MVGRLMKMEAPDGEEYVARLISVDEDGAVIRVVSPDTKE